MLLSRLRQMTANFGKESWCCDEHEAPTVVVASGCRDALSELACKVLHCVLLMSATRLQTGASRARTATSATRAHDHAPGSVGTQIAIMSCCERVLERFECARRRTRLAQFEYGGVPRVGDENRVTTHRRILRVEAY